MWQECKRFLNNRRWAAPAIVFVASIVFSEWFWPTLTFVDGDSFYHAKITELLARGVPRDFPWLPFTTLAENYIDHHFLYHVFLFPFAYFLGSFLGLKLATILLTAGALTLFYVMVRDLALRGAVAWTTLLLLSPSFIFRMHLAKAPAFSLIFILLGFWFLERRRPVALGILAFVYVWAYNAWPLLLFITLLWITARSFFAVSLADRSKDLEEPHEYPRPPLIQGEGDLSEREDAPADSPMLRKRREGIAEAIRSFWATVRSSEHARPLVGVLIGTLLGMLVNPYFPANLAFYWLHIVQIGIVNYQSKIGVGAEWYGMSFGELFGAHAVTFAAFAVALGLVLVRARTLARTREPVEPKILIRAASLVVIASAFFILTLRARRMVDYFLPFAVLATAALFDIGAPAWRQVVSGIGTFLARKKNWFVVPPAVIIAASVLALQTDSLRAHRRVLNDGFTPTAFGGGTTWLREHAPPGSVIFHSRWDTFPILFYHLDQFSYIVGLDTTFLYARDPERYELWRRIVYGEYGDDPVAVIRERFRADYIFLDKRDEQETLRRKLERSRAVKRVYEDHDSAVFTIRD